MGANVVDLARQSQHHFPRKSTSARVLEAPSRAVMAGHVDGNFGGLLNA